MARASMGVSSRPTTMFCSAAAAKSGSPAVAATVMTWASPSQRSTAARSTPTSPGTASAIRWQTSGRVPGSASVWARSRSSVAVSSDSSRRAVAQPNSRMVGESARAANTASPCTLGAVTIVGARPTAIAVWPAARPSSDHTSMGFAAREPALRTLSATSTT